MPHPTQPPPDDQLGAWLAGLADTELAAYLAALDDTGKQHAYTALDSWQNAQTDRTVDLGASALWYAQRLRWPVFPCHPSGKAPLVVPAAGFRHGFRDATTDPDRLRAAWQAVPDANIATPTGISGCGYDVIDVDAPHGFISLGLLKHSACPDGCSDSTYCPAQGELSGQQAAAITGRGGRHYYLPASGSPNATAILPGIDIRGDGGYVVIAPSVGEQQRYTWLTRPPVPLAVATPLDRDPPGPVRPGAA